MEFPRVVSMRQRATPPVTTIGLPSSTLFIFRLLLIYHKLF